MQKGLFLGRQNLFPGRPTDRASIHLGGCTTVLGVEGEYECGCEYGRIHLDDHGDLRPRNEREKERERGQIWNIKY